MLFSAFFPFSMMLEKHFYNIFPFISLLLLFFFFLLLVIEYDFRIEKCSLSIRFLFVSIYFCTYLPKVQLS